MNIVKCWVKMREKELKNVLQKKSIINVLGKN